MTFSNFCWLANNLRRELGATVRLVDFECDSGVWEIRISGGVDWRLYLFGGGELRFEGVDGGFEVCGSKETVLAWMVQRYRTFARGEVSLEEEFFAREGVL